MTTDSPSPACEPREQSVQGLPLVLIGETRSRRNIAALQQLGWGRMFVVNNPTPYPFEPWGFDNGAFIAWCHGEPFPETTFLRRLERAHAVNSDPYLAVTPDIVAGGRASLDFSASWITRHLLPDWPWYLAVQDGMTVNDVEQHLHLYAGIFLGGTDRFKATAGRWAALAHKHQKRFHYGRASTPGKLVSAFKVRAHSCDSAFPLWTQERMTTFAARWHGLGHQREIEYGLAGSPS